MPDAAPGPIVHDAEYYILREQHKDRWADEDADLDARLEALREKHGSPPNINHIMWDDMAFGDAGIPVVNNTEKPIETSADEVIALVTGRGYSEPEIG